MLGIFIVAARWVFYLHSAEHGTDLISPRTLLPKVEFFEGTFYRGIVSQKKGKPAGLRRSEHC
jgi:hypothetical protein